VVGDLAGFAAAVYLRGIKFIQIPTTLLSMIDSSVGGKTGINTDFGKNLVGAFYQPSAVVIDPDVLRTLPKRELTAGFCEAVKQGAIGGRKLFDLTEQALGERLAFGQFDRFLAEQVRFKASIVAADERESAAKTDAKSRKILNFGHTFGHAIEKVTRYRRFKHGEAVGHGIIFAAELSKKLELLAEDEVKLLNDVVHRTGVLPPLHGIDPSEVFEAFKFDKKNIGKSLQWILLKGIGQPIIKPGSEVPAKVLKDTLRAVIGR
jgi:3-dehydroquinate synthase